MVPAGIYADQGFSGLQSSQRKEFMRMIGDCEDGKIDQILVKSISRFSRNAAECIGYLQRLKGMGIAVQFEKEGMSSFDREAGLLLSIYASIAQNESCVLSQSVCWSKRHSAALGKPSQRTCYGFRLARSPDGKNKLWKIVPEEAERIRLMFDLAGSAHSFQEIVRALNELEIASGSEPFWTYGRVRAALMREAYRGDLLTNKTVVLDYARKRAVRNEGFVDQFYIVGHHEPIVDAVVFHRVQEYLKGDLLDGRNKKQRSQWLKEHGKAAAAEPDANACREVADHDQEQ